MQPLLVQSLKSILKIKHGLFSTSNREKFSTEECHSTTAQTVMELEKT